MAKDLSLVLDPAVAFIAEIDGKPAGMCIMVPNLNEVIADMKGALFPFTWVKLLWRTKVKRPISTRLILLGVREEYRKNIKRYGGLSAAMMVEVAKRGMARGYKTAELSWTRLPSAFSSGQKRAAIFSSTMATPREPRLSVLSNNRPERRLTPIILK